MKGKNTDLVTREAVREAERNRSKPQTVCPKCSAKIKAGMNYCGKCGAKIFGEIIVES